MITFWYYFLAAQDPVMEQTGDSSPSRAFNFFLYDNWYSFNMYARDCQFHKAMEIPFIGVDNGKINSILHILPTLNLEARKVFRIRIRVFNINYLGSYTTSNNAQLYIITRSDVKINTAA